MLTFHYIQKLKGQYGSEWNCQSLSEFSFTQGCDQVSIECQGYNLQGMAEVVLLSNNEVVTYVYGSTIVVIINKGSGIPAENHPTSPFFMAAQQHWLDIQWNLSIMNILGPATFC